MHHIVVGTAGHIDHGKSALVYALTGTDPDRLKEEKARGITIDLGFAHYTSDEVSVALIDVPGHERFVKNMLAGATGIDAVMLVVAADESVMPQTREHFAICRLLEVPRGIVVLTKCDLVDEDTRELVRLEVRELVAGSFLEDAPIVDVSSKSGMGLPMLRDALHRLAHDISSRPLTGATRLPVDRVFTVKGFGTVVTGTLVSGEIRVDDELAAAPLGRLVKVRGVQVHGRNEPRGVAGQRTAVNLGGVDVADLERGQTLVTPGSFEATRQLDACMTLLSDARPLRHGARIRFHQGTSEVLGRVAVASIEHRMGNADGGSLSEIPPGGRAYVRLRLEAPAVLTRGDRFILRAYSPSITIGGGEVLDPQPPRGRIRSDVARSRFQRLDPSQRGGAMSAPSIDSAVLAMVDERGAMGLPLTALVSRAGIAPQSVNPVMLRLGAEHGVVRAGDLLVAAAVVTQLKERLLTELRTYHAAQPLSDGLPREEARERLLGRGDPAVFDRVLEELVAEGGIVAKDRLALAQHRVALSPDEAAARDRIEQLFASGGLKPPDTASLSDLIGVRANVAEPMLKLLLRQKVLVKVETLVFHAHALQQLKDDVLALKAAGQTRVDVAAFKDRYGVTRKFAIPLLEYLDRERITRRVGEARIVL